MPAITIIGTGCYVPGQPVTNDDLSRVMDTTDEWIRRRTGIHQRHYVSDGVGVSDLAFEASKKAIESAGISAREIDYIVFSTMTPDYVFPGSGGLLGAKLEIPGVPALDIRQQCCAMPFGLQLADSLVKTNVAKTVLLVGAEAHAGFMPWDNWNALSSSASQGNINRESWDRSTRHRALAVLFGDGAGAMVLRDSGDSHRGFVGALIRTDGRLFEQIYIPGGGFRERPYANRGVLEREEYIPRMEGKELFKHAVTKLPQVVRELCETHRVKLDEIDRFIAHQANDRINNAVREALKIGEEKVPSNIARYGNTSAATIPILTDELMRNGQLKKGQLICFLALGAGLHWGAALMRL